MFKWVAATLAVLYCMMVIFGDPGRLNDRPIFSAQTSPIAGLFFASAAVADIPAVQMQETISDEAAVDLAIATGAALRAERNANVGPSLRGLVAAVEAAADQPFAPPPEAVDVWFVTGTKVNLRAGPGTGNAVVAQLTLGTETRALSDPTSDWVEIETTDGAAHGFIFSRFLSQSRPS